MQKVLIVGAGKIGQLIAQLLKETTYYDVILVDNISSPVAKQLDITDNTAVSNFFAKYSFHTVISCLPYFHTLTVAEIAHRYQLNYIDLTEEIQVKETIARLAASSSHAFVSHCGIAPGLSGIMTYSLMKTFSSVESVRIRVGGLPQYADNALHYKITWSLDGLINEYGNTGEAITYGKIVATKPLTDIETLEIDGKPYEAFNTSGGLGNLITLCQNHVQHLDYKTIRYPGHAEKMRFLMQDLKLNTDRQILKYILANALPETHQDILLIVITVTGKRDGRNHEENIIKKYYPREINGKMTSALQIITAASLCAVLDVVSKNSENYAGLVYQESIPFSLLEEGPFAVYLQ